VSKGYSIVSHALLERVCSVPTSGRTKDLFWLVYRHTIGRSAGRDAGREWLTTSAGIMSGYGFKRSTLHRCLAQAAELGLVTATKEGHNWRLGVGPEFVPKVGHDIPKVGHDIPKVGHDIPKVGHDIPYSGSNARAARPLIRRRKEEEEEGRTESTDPTGSAYDRLLFLISEGTASRSDVEAELFRLVELEESTDDDVRIEARNMRAHLLNTLERHR
jgi:hypothetical protein